MSSDRWKNRVFSTFGPSSILSTFSIKAWEICNFSVILGQDTGKNMSLLHCDLGVEVNCFCEFNFQIPLSHLKEGNQDEELNDGWHKTWLRTPYSWQLLVQNRAGSAQAPGAFLPSFSVQGILFCFITLAINCCGKFNSDGLCKSCALQVKQIKMRKCTHCTFERLRAVAQKTWVTITSEMSLGVRT